MKGSPFWTIHPVRSKSVIVRDVTVIGGTWNDDGCDPESCTDVLIEGCTFTTRDDNIAIKAGRDNDAWASNGGKACENIVIRNCRFLAGSPGGVAAGSEMSGDVRNVFVENCTMGKVQNPFYIKSNTDRGGVVENYRARNVTVEECNTLLKLETNYKGQTKGAHPPRFSVVRIEGVRCKKAVTAIDCQGLPGYPILDVNLLNVTVDSAQTAVKTVHTEGFHLDNVKVNGQLLK